MWKLMVLLALVDTVISGKEPSLLTFRRNFHSVIKFQAAADYCDRLGESMAQECALWKAWRTGKAERICTSYVNMIFSLNENKHVAENTELRQRWYTQCIEWLPELKDYVL